jgi:hypothetical protein
MERDFVVIVPYMHMMFFDQIHPLLLFLIPSSLSHLLKTILAGLIILRSRVY